MALLQWFGAVYVVHVVKSASATNNVFVGAEANVVATDHLYPRALLTPFTDNVELTRGDRKTYAGQAKAQRAKGFERIDVTFDERDSKDAQA